MRKLFIKKLHELAEKDRRIILLTGDLGFDVIESFQKSFPERCYNVGISEQNMIGIATGLAKDGYIPFCYSIAPFALLRPYEFIKNGPVLHNLKVRIIATGGGFEYGDAGYTHYCLEDVAITRTFPNLESYFPINNENAADLLEKTYDIDLPIYYRIGKNKNSLSDDIIKSYNKNGIEVLKENKNNTTAVICLSSTIDQGIKAFNQNPNFNLYALTKINKEPKDEIIKLINKHKKIITVESAYKNGGIGDIFSDIICNQKLNNEINLIKLSVNKAIEGTVGNQNFMEEKYNISSKDILNNL